MTIWTQNEVREIVIALEQFRQLTPDVMKALMYRGRDELLLADRVHQIDAKAREALAKVPWKYQ